MELKPGYKQTEVGVIPEGWDCVHIGDVAETSSGATPPRAKQQEYFDRGTTLWVKTLDLNNSSILETDECVTPSALQQTSLRLYPSGSVLVAMYGGFNQIGRTGMLTKDATINQALTAIRPDQSRLSSRLLLNYLNFRVEYWKSVASSSRKDPNITGRDVREFPIPLPPLREQEAAGEALQDIEDQILMFGELIDKKTKIKQAAMQELLTGKRRLPGFEGEWEVKRLGEICEIGMGRTPSRLDERMWGSGHPWLSIADLQKKVVSESKEQITEIAAALMSIVRKGTLLMSFKLSIGRLCFAGCDLFTNEAICSFNRLTANPDYLYYALGRTDFSLYGKQAVKGYTLNKESLNLVEVELPSQDEQTAIATVLSDMDSELLDLEARCEKCPRAQAGDDARAAYRQDAAEMKISTILDHIDNGHIALPEFQRGYVWNRDQLRGLFDSLYKRHLVDGLLVWATESQPGTLAYDFADPDTGEQRAVFDLAWPNGIQEELSQPVAVLLNEGEETLGIASAAGYRCFTTPAAFKTYVVREILSVPMPG
ncbi:restriction endonuclease subunit S [Synechococcus sp. CS-1328]|uniref:restriction endonuclease subunit S n=1 Tax=Synechococcus sp. CS-1328 TaxID=2847976 RepID=UPI00223B23B1|nr:restriction endonuclease subunit S [Synechococcus sp. CS-1328]MCT0224749.1 restriction endonuclease subunit S [Synechococcus sp. CS-1328]